VGVAGSRAVRRKHFRRQQMSWYRQSQRSSLRRPRPVSKVPWRYLTLSRSQRQGMLLQHWWSSPPTHPEHGRTTQAQLAMGGSLLDCNGDWTKLVPPPNTWRWQRQQLVEHRPALSILHVVSRLPTRSPSLYDYYSALCCKRPPGPSISLRTTLLQDPVSTANNGSLAVQSIKDSNIGLHRGHVLLDPAYTATNGSTAVGGLRV
jgi:hypothetical protein